MKTRIVGAVLGSLCLAVAAGSPVRAASASGGTPSIRITNLHEGQTVPSTTLTVQVEVSHFKLVPPVILSPSLWKTIPLLKGDQGHIHYFLDGLSNALTRAMTVTTSHTWTNVAPGEHTVTVALATSQHALFPGTRPVSVHVIVEPQMAGSVSGNVQQARQKASAKAPARRDPAVKAMPKSGGAGSGGSPDILWPLGLLGLVLLGAGAGAGKAAALAQG